MKTKFNSQICTTREQSERLLALGLRKETADLYWSSFANKEDSIWLLGLNNNPDYNDEHFHRISAWSLHRLIELTRLKVTIFMYGVVIEHPQWRENFARSANAWDNLCDAIEWLIKEGYFNKEYLEK